MNVRFNTGVEGYKTCAYFEPEPYDGHVPVDSVHFESRLRTIDPNLAAVFSALALERFVARSLVLEAGVQVHVVEAIELYYDERRFSVLPVEHTPRAIPSGTRRIVLKGEKDIAPGSSDRSTFAVGCDLSMGTTVSTALIYVASNIGMLFENSLEGRVRASIASAVLMSSDYLLGELIIERPAAESLGPALGRMNALLESVGMRMSVEGEQ